MFRRLSEMGYRNVEPFTLSGLHGGAVPRVARQVRAQGVRPPRRRRARPEAPADIDQILADNRTLGIKYFGSGSTPIFPPIYTTEAQWVAYAKYLE